MKESLHIFSGSAKLKEGTDLAETYKYLTVLMKVDMDTGVIEDFEVPIYSRFTSDFVAALARGHCLHDGIDAIVAEIERRIHTSSKRALISALQVAYNRYCLVKEGRSGTARAEA